MNYSSSLLWHGQAEANERADMAPHLGGKTILIVQGSLLAGAELADAFEENGARVHLTSNCINAFDLLRRIKFDGAVIDQGLHNEAFDLCSELRDLAIPYMCCAAPHRLHKLATRKRDADHAVWRMVDVMSKEDRLGAVYAGIGQPRHESLTVIGS